MRVGFSKVIVALGLLVLIVSFQNCSPSKVSGSSASDGSKLPSLLGTAVDLDLLKLSPRAPSGDILYPPVPFSSIFEYKVSSPVMESVILNQESQYTDLIWVSGESEKIIGEGPHLNLEKFNPSLHRTIFVFAKKESTSYLLSQIRLNEKSQSSSISDSNQFVADHFLMDTQNGIEKHLVSIRRTDVDLKSLEARELTVGLRKFANQRAFVVEKSPTEKLIFDIFGTDIGFNHEGLLVTLEGSEDPVYPPGEPEVIFHPLTPEVVNSAQGASVPVKHRVFVTKPLGRGYYSLLIEFRTQLSGEVSGSHFFVLGSQPTSTWLGTVQISGDLPVPTNILPGSYDITSSLVHDDPYIAGLQTPYNIIQSLGPGVSNLVPDSFRARIGQLSIP